MAAPHQRSTSSGVSIPRASFESGLYAHLNAVLKPEAVHPAFRPGKRVGGSVALEEGKRVGLQFQLHSSLLGQRSQEPSEVAFA